MSYGLMADLAMLAWQLMIVYWIIRLQICVKGLSNSTDHMIGAMTKMVDWTWRVNELMQSLVKEAGTPQPGSGRTGKEDETLLLRLPTTAGHVWISARGITAIQDVGELPGTNGVKLSGSLVIVLGVGHYTSLSAEEVRRRMEVVFRTEAGGEG